MFQRLTSLFFSDSSTPEGLEEPKPFVEEEEEEDGWLIIDLAGEQSSRTVFPQPLAGASAAGGAGDAPSQEYPSWFVTPPPCFTAEEPGPDGVGSSPMEDLLIEHPSMSVYVTSTLECPMPTSGNTAYVAGCPRCHHAWLAAPAAALDKAGQAQRAQRARQLAERHRLAQKALQRQNRARQRPPRRAKQLPGAFVHQPCQRHCNY
uniref:Tumor protein p53 inducible nuclear protein 2 n=1 Tax=Junco hyemalis TaxID=40217 RepID=A0A8C5INH8_JUNHY